MLVKQIFCFDPKHLLTQHIIYSVMRQKQLEKQIDALNNKISELHTNLFYFTLDFKRNGQYENYYDQINLKNLDAKCIDLLAIKNELMLAKSRIFGGRKK